MVEEKGADKKRGSTGTGGYLYTVVPALRSTASNKGVGCGETAEYVPASHVRSSLIPLGNTITSDM